MVVLNDIHIEIMDYISPATCADVAFRNMWAEFEWENKVICHFLELSAFFKMIYIVYDAYDIASISVIWL